MKKYYLILAISILLTSCGGGDSSSESSGGEIESASDANQIIGFNNDVVDYLNTSSNQIEKAADFLDDFASMIGRKVNNHGVMNHIIFIGIALDMEKIVAKTPSVISDELKNNLKELDKNYQLVKEQNKVISKYRKNQDFKDDNWKKGQETLDLMNQGITGYYASQELISKELKVIGDKAEEKILEDHPLKDPILSAKKDLDLMDDLQSLLFADALDRDAIKVAYDVLEESSKKHREEFNEMLEEQNEKNSYDSFHEDIDDYLGEVRKRLRFNKPFKTGDYNSISNDYESVIGGYNSFVN